MQCVWDDVRLHLRRFLVNQLQSQQETQNDTLQQKLQFKTQCLQHLLFIYPESDVLVKYQKMQNKWVRDLLQKYVLGSIGETNFEKMVHGYECLVPALCAMIKEDLCMLSGITDFSSTLKFITEAYLDTITEELSVLLEKHCEPQMKENALHDVKASRSSKKEKGITHVWG